MIVCHRRRRSFIVEPLCVRCNVGFVVVVIGEVVAVAVVVYVVVVFCAVDVDGDVAGMLLVMLLLLVINMSNVADSATGILVLTL